MFWLVWSEQRSNPTFKHVSERAAREEAERLARMTPGHVFHVLALIDSCKKIDVEWESQKDFIPM